jgi:gas vesicle protein
MTGTAIAKFIETVGVPVAVAAACGFVVWWLLKWLTGSVLSQFSELRQEIKNETDDVQKDIQDHHDDVQNDIKQLHGITISLIDRIRVLERNSLLFYTTVLSQLGCKDLPVWHETRRERVAELKEQIKDIGRNGETE